MEKRKKYTSKYDDALYWERVNRNLGWLGDAEEEQRFRQKKIRDVVIGLAGCGGLGGGVAERLVRMGVRNLKLADPDTFDLSNINRQLGATIDNVGKNKAEVVAEHVYNITRDVNIEVYPEGIKENTVDEFFDGCDYVGEMMDIYAIDDHYTIHEGFRRSGKCKSMMYCPVIGYRMFVFKTTKKSLSMEEVYGLPKNTKQTEKYLKQVIERLIPEMPRYPKREMLDKWFIDMVRCPIFAGTPPISQGIYTTRLALEITGLNDLPGVQQLPEQPGYAMFDAMTWETKIVRGKWWENENTDSIDVKET